MRFKQIILCALTLVCTALFATEKIKVACVGDSITFGSGVENRGVNNYPTVLQGLLGDKYEVGNFGKPGATLLARGHNPYIKNVEYKNAIAFAGDIVVIHLGVNDTDPRNWPFYRDNFTTDYLNLINDFKKANPKAKIFICRLTPILSGHGRFRSGTRDWYWQICENIDLVGEIANVPVIELREKLAPRPDLIPDNVHPNAEGAKIIAQKVYGAISGDFGGLSMAPIFSDNMILQRSKNTKISGIANVQDIVEVAFGDKKAHAITDVNGKWTAELGNLTASTKPQILTITAGKKTLTYRNVLVGDVWICAGQSNMVFMVRECVAPEKEVAKAFAQKENIIRFYNQKPKVITNNVAWSVEALNELNKLNYYNPTTWTQCGNATINDITAIGFFFAQRVTTESNIPIGLINVAIGGSGAEAWMDRKITEFEIPEILTNWRNSDFIQAWARGRANCNIRNSKVKGQRHPYEPCFLYETAILPLKDFVIKGTLWYQGESNAQNVELHEKYFPLVVKSFRQLPSADEVAPFLTVQLSSMDHPERYTWPQFRDSQRRMGKAIPNSGSVVSSDRGAKNDVHPKQKMDIGYRLAALALHNVYGKKNIVPTGPEFVSKSVAGKVLTVSFENGKGMKAADGNEIRGFEIAGKDRIFHAAIPKVVGETIQLTSEKVANPVYVRYAWKPFTDANLVNNSNLPASTFKE